ncbi:GNAT family N-acetyltransferase [Acidobacterium sp. S8]|uniref:GNAT family N-acetyltransferase n=1 Tax=Acidobacterium sp. S8 TaxID=1641854 RepID=UPI0020B13DBA|nr:GNAT family N-acyltransferase [Acidobacterium sp. S8]
MLTYPRPSQTGNATAPTSISPEYPRELIADTAIAVTSPVHISGELGRYGIRLAASEAEREAACRLRFKVFNIELGEGLISSYSTGIDKDQFDYVCDHLIVEDRSSGKVVGTYRMQSGGEAARSFGYYSAREFDFAAYEPLREQVLELGRASVDCDHRSSEVLTLLWRGIAQYCRYRGLRYLIGCSSLNSQDPAEGWAVYGQLQPFLASSQFCTWPTPGYRLPTGSGQPQNSKIPKLLKTYIGVGARICGEPAWDREFGTIDFLTLLDLRQLTPAARNRFLPDGEQ